MELVRNRSFTLTTGTRKQSRLRRYLRNDVPQGSVLAFLFPIHVRTYDLPATAVKKFANADDEAILHYASNLQALEETLTQDMATLSSYLYKWKLKLSTTKTVSAAFHLCNKEARREFNIFVNRQALTFCAEPTYLGKPLILDWALTFRRHLESLCKKITSFVGILRQLSFFIFLSIPYFFISFLSK